MADQIYDMDDFWDLTPHVKKKRESSLESFSQAPSVVLIEEITVDDSEVHETTATPLTCMGEHRSFTDESYAPSGMPLIRQVTVRHFNDRYDFYEGFSKSAKLYYDVRGSECDFVPFYSYMPQYTQMNNAQKAYYFYMRDEIRKGNYIRSDYSYLYLYAYEIFNLPELIAPEEGIRILCNLWRAYRKDLPRIDKLFSLWVEDYCFVWKLPSPTAQISDFIFDILRGCPLREFYLSDIETACVSGVLSLVSVLSDYDWKSGRYATGESAKAYRMHMEGALSFALSAVIKSEIESIHSMPTQHISRDAFVNSLCTHRVKCKLEIEYYSLEQLKPLRAKIGNLVKYVENKLRKQLGVKSRLTVNDLPKEYTQPVDLYFESVFKENRRKSKAEQTPEYERHYDAPVEELSISGALEIEESSWETTSRLVEDIEHAEERSLLPSAVEADRHVTEREDAFSLQEGASTPKITSAPEITGRGVDGTSQNENEEVRLIMKFLLDGNIVEAKALCLKNSVPMDYLVEKINEIFIEEIGDSVIESDGMSYAIIEDYREDIEKWLTR